MMNGSVATGSDTPSGTNDKVVLQEYFEIVLREDGIAWLRRSDIVYPSVAAVHGAYDAFLRVVDDWSFDRRIKSGRLGTKVKTPFSWLFDLRGAPERRNDPAFEQVVQQRRADLLKRSPVLAILVKTASGRMQVTRMARTGNASMLVFDDFDEAVAALREGMKREA
jgi:hypothetical protein